MQVFIATYYLIQCFVSLVDSNHGVHEGMMLLEQHQFFGSLNFPVTEEPEAWKEKVMI